MINKRIERTHLTWNVECFFWITKKHYWNYSEKCYYIYIYIYWSCHYHPPSLKPVFNVSFLESKVGHCSRGRPDGSLLNSYYTEVLGRALFHSLDWSTLSLICTLKCWVLSKTGSSTIFWYDFIWDWTPVSGAISKLSTHLFNGLGVFIILAAQTKLLKSARILIRVLENCLARRHQEPFFESLVWQDLGLNSGLPNYLRTLYSLGVMSLKMFNPGRPLEFDC